VSRSAASRANKRGEPPPSPEPLPGPALDSHTHLDIVLGERPAGDDHEFDLTGVPRRGLRQPVVGHGKAAAVGGRPEDRGAAGSADLVAADRSEALVGLIGERPRFGSGDEAFGIDHHAAGEQSKEDQR